VHAAATLTRRCVAAVRRAAEARKGKPAAEGGGTSAAPSPAVSALLTPSTPALSPYLKFGCVSPRLFASRVRAVYASAASHSAPPVSLLGQLLWRDFYYAVALGTPRYNAMAGNPICRQVPWGADAALLAAWEHGRTGFPWIDAAMVQLRTQGWLHHLARHAVACFLTRGDLWQSWEAGAAVFDRLLLDADFSLNNGNWMWLSASAFFHQFFRVYSPVTFPKKYDPHGAYVRHFLPALRAMPDKYIYEPWKAPLEVQKAAGCIIGTHYPAPVVDHDTASKANIARMTAAYAAHRAAHGGEEQEDGGAPAPAAKKAKRAK
jgi:cryptochrome